MRYDYHIVIIGAGSGGLVVASGAASIGAKVALIEKSKMGGDCLNYGCVPSKSFLKAAHTAAEIRDGKKYGITTGPIKINIRGVMNHVKSVIKAIEPHDSAERFTGLGVDVISGAGFIEDAHTVKVGNKKITTKYIVVSTGSEAAVPPIKGLNKVPYLTNKNVFNLNIQPRELIILGGGPIGLELGQGFLHLGSKVYVIDMLDKLFPKDDPEVAGIMEKIFTDEGMKLYLSSKILEINKKGTSILVTIEKDGREKIIKGDQLLVSLGRKPVSENLGLDESGVKRDKRGFIITNNYLQTSVENIYTCGDVAGPFQFTHMAGYQAGVILRNITFPLKKSAVDYSAVPWTTYTRPEVSHVGYTEQWAKESGLFKDSILVNLEHNNRARSENDTEGFLKVITGNKGRVIGATMVGNKAGEIIPMAAMAIKQKLKISSFMSVIFSYPVEAEIFKTAGLEAARESFKPWMKSLLKKLVFS